jgi:hypothetical protein
MKKSGRSILLIGMVRFEFPTPCLPKTTNPTLYEEIPEYLVRYPGIDNHLTSEIKLLANFHVVRNHFSQ